jgi:competence ComEA-like helix-hairpin-helix protein
MRFPFLRSANVQRPEPNSTLVVPPRVTTTPRPQAQEQAVESQLPFASTTALAVMPSVPVRLGSILSQIPSQIFHPRDRDELASILLDIPSAMVLPQLASGKISMTLADLIPLLPPESVVQPLPSAIEQQSIALPLAEIIASIPPDALLVQHESVIATDTPEFDSLPKLFEDALLEEAVTNTVATDEEVPITEDPLLTVPSSKPPAQPIPAPTVPIEALSVESPNSDVPKHVLVSLRNLVSVMPDRVFGCSRSDLWRKADFDLRVQLPTEPILPQLKTAHVTLPLSTVIHLVPPALLANPLPIIGEETVPVPLEEVVPQLPPSLFITGSSEDEVQVVKLADADIPLPFQEKSVESLDVSLVNAVTPDQPPVAEVKPLGFTVDSTSVLDETYNVFAEKPPEVEIPDSELPKAVETATDISEPAAKEIDQSRPVEPTDKGPEPIAAPPTTIEILPQPIPEFGDIDKKQFLIDLNRCTVEDLQTIQGIGPALARRIIEFRDAKGRFTSMEELRQIPGIGRKTFRALAGAEPRALNQLLGVEHDRELSLQEIVRLTGNLPGIDGCMLAMSDGLFLTGELPLQLDRDTISVFAPQLFKKVGRYARELKVGQIRRFTIFTDQQPLSIFRAGEVYLIVIHDTRHFSKALLLRCERISQEIARLCRQRAVV